MSKSEWMGYSSIRISHLFQISKFVLNYHCSGIFCLHRNRNQNKNAIKIHILCTLLFCNTLCKKRSSLQKWNPIKKVQITLDFCVVVRLTDCQADIRGACKKLKTTSQPTDRLTVGRTDTWPINVTLAYSKTKHIYL